MRVCTLIALASRTQQDHCGSCNTGHYLREADKKGVAKGEMVDHLVKLPVESRNQSLTQTAGNLIKVNIRDNGAYVVMGQAVTEEKLTEWMQEEREKKPEIKVLVRCDKESKHLYLANVMSICRFVGVPEANIAVRTEK